MIDLKIKIVGDIARVKTPYSKEFNERLRGLDSRWNPDYRCWEIPADAVDACRNIMQDVFGQTDIESGPLLKIRLRFNETVSAEGQPVVIMGKDICRATNRDSGGRAGKDVVYEKGLPESGGSRMHWDSIVPAGSVVVISRVPKSLYDKYVPGSISGLETEVIEDQTDSRENLMKEKERLLKRLKEIDEELAKLQTEEN